MTPKKSKMKIPDNFFPVPHAVEEEFGMSLTVYQKFFLMALFRLENRFTDTPGEWFWHTDPGFVDKNGMPRGFTSYGISVSTCKRARKKLKALGLIETKAAFHGDLRRSGTMYRIRWDILVDDPGLFDEKTADITAGKDDAPKDSSDKDKKALAVGALVYESLFGATHEREPIITKASKQKLREVYAYFGGYKARWAFYSAIVSYFQLEDESLHENYHTLNFFPSQIQQCRDYMDPSSEMQSFANDELTLDEAGQKFLANHTRGLLSDEEFETLKAEIDEAEHGS